MAKGGCSLARLGTGFYSSSREPTFHDSFILTLKCRTVSTAMAPVFAKPVNSQKDCPLFSKIPQIRDRIFDLVVTPHEEKHVPYPEALRYSRPGFRHSDRKLSITILRCCERIYLETCDLPAKKYIQIDWICAGKNGHDANDGNCWNRSLPTALQNLHLFTTKYWLREAIPYIWGRYTPFVATYAPNLRNLKITLEHDNNSFEAKHDIFPNAKQRGLSPILYMEDSAPFEEWSWGNQLRAFESLNVLEIEIETLEENKEKLDLNLVKTTG